MPTAARAKRVCAAASAVAVPLAAGSGSPMDTVTSASGVPEFFVHICRVFVSTAPKLKILFSLA
jgi:hypothetical protein